MARKSAGGQLSHTLVAIFSIAFIFTMLLVVLITSGVISTKQLSFVNRAQSAPQTFIDVPATHPFYSQIQSLANKKNYSWLFGRHFSTE